MLELEKEYGRRTRTDLDGLSPVPLPGGVPKTSIETTACGQWNVASNLPVSNEVIREEKWKPAVE
jgi:hypothetical protein